MTRLLGYETIKEKEIKRFYLFLLALTNANTDWRMMNTQRRAAVAMFAQLERSFPFVLTSTVIVPVIRTPKNEPITLPTPPVKSVPPITADAIASISNPVA